ncbi:GAF domain-containing protein [Actinoplanes sp. TRM 88003]|uniref:GAF domain-containing protein n=1 Tax=Paractinoplanes aksuensis TaxID=2939490 RepID=A0ABT1E0J8_9ACTN|nr:GAF domain-containing protein [Actinoplanes aksuensis]MCO8276665.1 GAF domain-containing protein [Actinoplanes aksuensis]
MQTTGAVQLRPWLEAIAAIATALNRPASLPEVLDLLSATASRLLGYDFCAVLLVDEPRSKLVITGAHGLSPRYIEQVNADHPVVLEPDDEPRAPSSRAFLTGTSVQVPDTVADATFLPWGGVARQQGYRSMISVPVFSAGIPVGTLNCYTRMPHEFGPDEQELLSLLADQAGVAIETARLREREAATIASLTTANTALRRGEEVHGQFTRVALRGGGVAGVAAALSELLGTAVTVLEEPSGVPLAAVGDPVEDGQATLVVLGNETVARIVVPRTASPLAALDVRALEHAATVCALEVLRARTAHEVEWRLSGEVVSDLLAGSAAGLVTAAERAGRLGLDLTKPYAVIVVNGGPSARILSVARSLAAAAQPRALAGAIGDDVVLLWPADAGSQAERLLTQLRRIGVGPEAAVAVSPPCQALADYPSAYRRGRGAATIARLRGTADAVASFGSLGVHGLLLQLQDVAELRRFAAETLAPIRTYDAARGTALEQTLRAYVSHDLNTAATAAALFVHPNTVNLRLRKAEQLLGVSTSQVRVLAELQVALSADDVADALAV